MKKKSGGGEGGGANWMDTYGDMVTLLLCFFVLLYSMSTVDENKWKALVQSFNPNATPAETEIEAGDSHGPFAEANDKEPGVADPDVIKEALEAAQEAMQEQINQQVDQLYDQLKQYIEESGKNIEITKGDGYVFLSLVDTVFFYPDKYDMLPEGKALLDNMGPVLKAAAPAIDEIRISGHTAQADPNEENDPEGDRMLSAERAAQVTYYLQQLCRPTGDGKPGIEPARIVGQSYGQHRPIAVNDDEHRKENRRVEMTITGKDLGNKLGDAVEQYYTQREGGSLKEDDAGSSAPTEDDSGSAPSSSGQEG
ncbi:OmpA/MotB family protein [Acutalibacter sp. 1XD8-36]|uniref:OmpA/MotB family protein n=1 Tax=Acutalibacter sp. 1XD8-36 TaxID=2320852 RepID=UPI0014122B38|nr:flagellar motor protein MotB [Acutalibacter sp. 1XD8-36]NBJ90272.1 hypothetical protein [Acutalibacter sp. 1XD8-36]